MSLRPWGEGGVVSIRKLAIRFNKFALFSSISFIMGGGSHVTLIKGGNTKGSAVLGVFTNLRSPASKAIDMPGRAAVNCLPRRVGLTSARAMHRRTRRTFRRVRRVRGRVRQLGRRLTRQASCRARSCRGLVSHIARLARRFRVVNKGGCRTRLRQALVNLKFDHRSFSQPASRFDKK